MKRTQLLTVLTVVLVLLAGCSSITGDDPAQTPKPTLDTVTYPAGVNETGIINSSKLIRAHSEALANESVTFELSTNSSQSGSTANTQRHLELNMEDDPDADRTRVVLNNSGATVAMYATDERTYVKQKIGTNTAYKVSNSTDSSRYSLANRDWASMLQGTFSYASFEPHDVVVRNGTTLIKLKLTGIDPSSELNQENASVTTDGTVLVDQQGVIHHSEIEIVVENEERNSTISYRSTADLRNVGSTNVEEPAWLDEAESSSGS